MAKKQIVALGGGGFSEGGPLILEKYILEQTGKERPKVCFVPTASGDSEGYVERFYAGLGELNCELTHLALFRRTVADLVAFACAQDVIYVGGGNTLNMMAIWRAHGVDVALREAYKRGTVMTGLSAGSICWFQHGPSDSFGGVLRPIDGLGILPMSHCPHYDSEESRRPTYQKLIAEGQLLPGYAADDDAALHFVEGKLFRVVAARPDAYGYRIERGDGQDGMEREMCLMTTCLIDA